ncbi:AbrB/MazE/SpoVT family DNA-binding domain-containing protein [Dactylosporangium sucinum]|uniref:AbrB/MazE/SpoVT family DNA-binding domain-containing protein n=1 Tax=Dactylosporangium sucinum TaxID=1424081 RepID=UPI001E2D55B3|nr:AbrB/MazE/SpoVT family DNA-binding domain-containing protein [Dactylosporangium sucinum]
MADRALMRRLGWAAGTRLHIIRAQSGSLLATAATDGVFTIGNQGHLVLPATVRHSCRLLVGDRVLLTADLDASVVAVHSPALVEAMIAGPHARKDDR